MLDASRSRARAHAGGSEQWGGRRGGGSKSMEGSPSKKRFVCRRHYARPIQVGEALNCVDRRDRQTDRLTDSPTDRRTDGRIGRPTNRPTDRPTDRRLIGADRRLIGADRRLIGADRRSCDASSRYIERHFWVVIDAGNVVSREVDSLKFVLW